MGDNDRCSCPCHHHGHGHDHDHHHHGDHHHGDHHHGDGHHRHEDRRGPPDSGFLDLEISRVLESRAGDMVRSALDELLREAVVERLRERMGARLRELGRAAADRAADDVEANLDIEARIAARREARAARSPGAPKTDKPRRGR
jgi:hypothetical protein